MGCLYFLRLVEKLVFPPIVLNVQNLSITSGTSNSISPLEFLIFDFH